MSKFSFLSPLTFFSIKATPGKPFPLKHFPLKQKGITLVEVLVALAIFSVVISVGMTTLGDSLSATRHLDRMTYAHWAAQNKMTELLLQPQWPATGRSNGETDELMGSTWYWSVEVKETTAKNLRRIEIEVKKDADFEGYDSFLVGFVGRY